MMRPPKNPKSSPPSRRVTIRDVARGAGVSVSTVSHVLSGKRPIGEAVKRRVHHVITRTGYRANIQAVNLSLQKTWQIGLLVSEVTSHITGMLLEHMEAAGRRAGYKVILGICGADLNLAIKYLGDFSAGMVDGVINLVPVVGAARAEGACGPVPVLTYDRPYPLCPAREDRVAGARAMASHLWALGHRKIGILYVEEAAPELPMAALVRGVYDFFKFQNVTANRELFCPVDPRDRNQIYACCDKLRRLGVTAIFCGSDFLAAVVLRWARDEKVLVPEHLSVTGFDDSPMARMLVPALTTAVKPIEALALATVEALVARIEGRVAPEAVTLSMQVVPRESSGLAPLGPNPPKPRTSLLIRPRRKPLFSINPEVAS